MSAARLSVRVQPRARRDEIVGWRGDALVVRVQAPALEGRANDRLRRVLADRLDVPPSAVRIVRGERSRDKVVEVDGADPAAIAALMDER